MYSSMMAFAVKNNGNVVREDKDTVFLPFGAEYSLFIKNLNTKRAIVKITIDGTDVCDGGFVVDANSSVDIERFVKNNDSGNRFKFIERTGNIEKSRGIGIEDGLIRVEYQFEIDRPVITWNSPFNDVVGSPYDRKGGGTGDPRGANNYNGDDGNILRSRRITTSSAQYNTQNQVFNTQEVQTKSLSNDVGITVPGSVSDQKFTQVSSFPLETTKHVMVMKILGVTPENKPVEVVTPSRQKQKCVTCERVNKASAKFCTECGTSLIIV